MGAWAARCGTIKRDLEVGDVVARKGRARRFREARELKQGFDDELFEDGGGTLADVDESADDVEDDDSDDGEDEEDQAVPWDPDVNPET